MENIKMAASIIDLILYMYYIVIVTRVLLTWFVESPKHPVGRFLITLTDPLLFPIREAIEPIQIRYGIDFSPAILILALLALQRLVLARYI